MTTICRQYHTRDRSFWSCVSAHAISLIGRCHFTIKTRKRIFGEYDCDLYDDDLQRDYVLSSATHHGRILVLNRESAVESTGHGSPMPLLVHGGPGRAGGVKRWED